MRAFQVTFRVEAFSDEIKQFSVYSDSNNIYEAFGKGLYSIYQETKNNLEVQSFDEFIKEISNHTHNESGVCEVYPERIGADLKLKKEKNESKEK